MKSKLLLILPIVSLLGCSPEVKAVGQPEDERPVSETYLIKQVQVSWATSLKPTLRYITGAGDRDGNRPEGSIEDDHWSKSTQYVNLNGYNDWRTMRVDFQNTSYDPDQTDIAYSNQHTLDDPLVNEGGRADVIDNTSGTSEIEHKISETFTQERSVESSFSESYSLDFHESSSTQVGGEFAGASFEETLSVEFGQSFSHEESQTKAESTSKEQSIEDTTVVDPGKKILISYATKKPRVQYDFDVNGVLTWGLKITLPEQRSDYGCYTKRVSVAETETVCPWGWGDYINGTDQCIATDSNIGWKNRGDNGEGAPELTWKTLDEFLDTWRGTNTDWAVVGKCNYPADRYFPNPEALNDADTRRIQLKGTQIREADSSIEYTVSDITDESCDEDAIRSAFDDNFEGSAADKLSSLGCQHESRVFVQETVWDESEDDHANRTVLGLSVLRTESN